ncbi:hypothetical protein CEXT_246911 [Caerostris extrusa]|uniref:Uncharacterized protein n=1 Tax=Caerostris extrusa TaxID=172846 RepID=A0AAV4UZE2_CAEEX|nr:hypothetical protein CEXT_246911 [Caerostris extrusa]
MDSTRANPKALFGDWSITKLVVATLQRNFLREKVGEHGRCCFVSPLIPHHSSSPYQLDAVYFNLLCRDCKISRHHLAPLNARFRALKVFEFEMTAIYSVLGEVSPPPPVREAGLP